MAVSADCGGDGFENGEETKMSVETTNHPIIVRLQWFVGGMMFWALLSGGVPFGPNSVIRLIYDHATGVPHVR